MSLTANKLCQQRPYTRNITKNCVISYQNQIIPKFHRSFSSTNRVNWINTQQSNQSSNVFQFQSQSLIHNQSLQYSSSKYNQISNKSYHHFNTQQNNNIHHQCRLFNNNPKNPNNRNNSQDNNLNPTPEEQKITDSEPIQEYYNEYETENENSDETSNENSNENENEFVEMTIGEKQHAHRTASVLSWKLVLLSGLGILIGSVIFQQIVYRHQQQRKQDEVVTYGEALIGGGEWKMKDHNNKFVDQDTFKGKYQIVYFGFTFCPDVCPRELTKLAHAIQLLEERGYGDHIIPLFVSVDPKRDTPALVSKFIRQFHPKIIGLTGTPEQVSRFAKAYKAYYSTPGPGENQDDYIVDHVTMMYIMGRNGEYLGHISTLENSDEMAQKVSEMIKDVGSSGGFLGKLFSNPKSLVEKK